MAELFQFALFAGSAMFVIVDPLGNVPLFLAFTKDDSNERRRVIARRACVVAWAVLTGFAFGGDLLFRVFGVTFSAFKVAGGLLLLLTAVDQLRAQPSRTRTSPEEQDEGVAKEDVSIVPLALPLLAGPGSIATAMMLMSRAVGPWHVTIVVIAITLVLVVTWLAFLSAGRIDRLFGTTGRLIAERLMGLLTAAIAMQFILDGVLEAMRK